MIVEMFKGCEVIDIQAVVTKIHQLGFEPLVNKGKERVVVAVLGAGVGSVDTGQFEALAGVEQVVRMTKPYKLSSRDFKRTNTVVMSGDLAIGNKEIVVMAGPCSVETEQQILACALTAKEAGAKVLRGGAYKPRTSPFAFQGLKEAGLKLLSKARKETGLQVVTEVVRPEDVALVSEHADILQIGARNMQNYPLLEAAGKCKRPVLLKRGLSATVEEWLMAADYVLMGNCASNVILCLRGIRTFDTITRFTYDIGILPALRSLTHLPIMVDPSHPAGNFRYVPNYAKMAVAAGSDGLIIEIHPDPANALSDGAQSLTFSDFHRLMVDLKSLAQVCDRKM